jgi:hypothetical protein
MLTDARKDYVRWCRTVGVTPVQLEVFDRELSGLIQRASLPIEHGPAGTINNGMAPRRLLRAAWNVTDAAFDGFEALVQCRSGAVCRQLIREERFRALGLPWKLIWHAILMSAGKVLPTTHLPAFPHISPSSAAPD